MIEKEESVVDFADKNAEEAIRRYFEVRADRDALLKKLTNFEYAKKAEIERAKAEMARTIFKDMYEIVSGATDETVVVTTADIKNIAKRYGVIEQ